MSKIAKVLNSCELSQVEVWFPTVVSWAWNFLDNSGLFKGQIKLQPLVILYAAKVLMSRMSE